jgi:spore maturation protein SpmB
MSGDSSLEGVTIFTSSSLFKIRKKRQLNISTIELPSAAIRRARFFTPPRRFMKKFIALFALSLSMIACNDMTPKPVENANLRVAHLSPTAPNVDIWLDGKVVSSLTNVPFKTVSGYLKIPVGKHDIAVYVTGTTTNPAINVVGIDLAKKNYTVAAIGLLAGSGAQALKANVYEDDLTLNATKARVRVIHASPDAPAVDVAVQAGAVVVNNLSYPTATASYLELAAGTYPLEIRATGAATSVLKFSTPALEAGKVYTVFAVDTLAKLSVVAVGDVAP